MHWTQSPGPTFAHGGVSDGASPSIQLRRPTPLSQEGKVWYHVSGTLPRLWTKLSSDCAGALRLWAQRESVPEDDSKKLFSVVAKRYVREIFPSKSIQTRKDNDKELANLLKVFAHMPSTPSHRCTSASTWTFAAKPPRCARTARKLSSPTSSIKLGNGVIRHSKAHAHFTVIDAMDLALLTRQRPADVLKRKRANIRDGALWTVQNKTGCCLGVEVTGELAAVIARINERPRRAISAFLIWDKKGQPLTQFAPRSRFDKARAGECGFSVPGYSGQGGDGYRRFGELPGATRS